MSSWRRCIFQISADTNIVSTNYANQLSSISYAIDVRYDWIYQHKEMSFGIDDSGRSDVLECNDQGKVRAVRKLEQSDSVGESRYAVLHIMMHSTARSLMCFTRVHVSVIGKTGRNVKEKRE